jgi:hypothetical protein
MILEQEVEKIRAARQRISARCNHDSQRLLEHYRQLSQELRASGQFRFAPSAAKGAPPALRDEPPAKAS